MRVLVMEDSDSSRSYYRVPDSWYAWVNDPTLPIPDDLRAEQLAEYGTVMDDEFSRRTRQAIAMESQWIGTTINEVAAAAEAAGERRVEEITGTYF